MRHHIEKLAVISRKPERTILGLMSGTSLDGLDVVCCTISGAGTRTRLELRAFETVAYDDEFKAEVRRVFAQQTVDFQYVTLLNAVVAEHHAAVVLDCLKRWGIMPGEIDLLASHGQTVFHAPRRFHGLDRYPNATLQLGDGDHLARRTGLITVSDFRQKHVAAGGEGAPLALYGDYFLFSQNGEDRVLLNIGGIANFTFLPGSGDAARVFATDTGPGNTLLDYTARTRFDVAYDENGALAGEGRVDEQLLAALRTDAFFNQHGAKTTGPEQFSPAWLDAALQRLDGAAPNPHDLLATLTRLTAETIAEAVGRLERTTRRAGLYVSGGGAHNAVLMRDLKALLPDWPQRRLDDLGVPGDAKEAVLFAVLANETVAGSYDEGAALGGLPMVGMGKISLPG